MRISKDVVRGYLVLAGFAELLLLDRAVSDDGRGLGLPRGSPTAPPHPATGCATAAAGSSSSSPAAMATPA